MADKRYDEEPAIASPLIDTDILCVSRSPFGNGAPFNKCTMQDIADYMGQNINELGLWNATTNTPTLVNSTLYGVGMFIVQVAGTTALDGISTWEIGDLVYFASGVWNRFVSVEASRSEQLSNKTIVADNSAFVDEGDPTKKFLVDLTANSLGVTSTVSFGATSNQDIQFPDTDYIVLGNTLTQTVTNKTFLTSCVFGDSSDSSKALDIDLSGMATNTSAALTFVSTAAQAITFPDGVAYEVLGDSITATVSNKSLVADNVKFVDGADPTKVLEFSTISMPTSTSAFVEFLDDSTITFPAGVYTVQKKTPVVSVTGSTQALTSNVLYLADLNGLIDFTLPAASVIGDVIKIVMINTGATPSIKISQTASQQIHLGTLSTTVGATGYITTTNNYSVITLTCATTNLTWVAEANQGTFTVV